MKWQRGQLVVVEKSAITYEHTVLVCMKDLGKGVSIRITSPDVAMYIRKRFGRLLFSLSLRPMVHLRCL